MKTGKQREWVLTKKDKKRENSFVNVALKKKKKKKRGKKTSLRVSLAWK